MTREQASKVVGYLNAGFHREALEPASALVWMNDVSLLAEFEVAQAAAAKIVRSADKFPTIHEFRVAYRAVLETQAPLPSLEPPPRETKRPEWVDVWGWARSVGDERWLPQQEDQRDLSRPRMSLDEYAELREAWLVAGAPMFFPAGPARAEEPVTVQPLDVSDLMMSPQAPFGSGPAVQA